MRRSVVSVSSSPLCLDICYPLAETSHATLVVRCAVHVHTGARAHIDACEILRNGQELPAALILTLLT
jgi:hypothetical protein